MKQHFKDNLAIFLFFVSSLIVLAIAVTTSVMVGSISGFLKENIEERLLATSLAAAGLVSAEELGALVEPSDMEKPLFRELRLRLIDFAEETNVMYVYYMRPAEGGMMQFIIDNDQTEDAVNLATPPIASEEAPASALGGVAATSGLGNYSEGYTGLLSSFSPVYDGVGRVVAIAGVDISDEQVMKTRGNVAILTVLMLFAMAGVIAGGCLSFILYKRKEDALSKRLRQQELMSELSQSFISTYEMPALINNALRMTGEFLGISRMLISVADEDAGVSRPAYVWSGIDGLLTKDEAGLNDLIFGSFPKKQPPGGPVSPIFCNDIHHNERYLVLENLGIKSFIWTPLYVRGEYWALLSIEECVRTREWNKSDVQLVGLVSNVIAGAAERDLIERGRAEALEQARSASRAKGDFLANMSHEMRTPMNAVIGMTAIARNSNDVDKKDYCLKKIDEASTHLLGVINDILDMSKIEANKFELSFTEFSFEEMLKRVVNVVNFRVDEKHIDFTVHVDEAMPGMLEGDDQRLAQVITNLLSNAVKFTPEQGKIRLGARLIGEDDGLCTIQIDVADTGIGISEDQKARLFASFEQADSSMSRRFGGTGLGLAISKRIVEMMGGRIWVESEIGKGSTFAFTMLARRGLDLRRKPPAYGVRWESLRIMSVDDMPDTAEHFRSISQRLGFACDMAESGAEALELIRKNGVYDICFVDWKMPGMDGMELSRRIKEASGGKSLVVMVSSAEWGLIEEEARASGIDGFLSKPLLPSSIADCINECLGSGAAADDARLAGDEAGCFKGRRILLAEDVEINREIVIALLEPTGLDIDCAVNGEEAVRLFCAAPDRYDMIFMDVQMPEMDGYEATRRIRSREAPGARRVPIVAMTANVFREDIERCLESGMDGHVGKPLNLDEVMSRLREFLAP
ncbi:MAG: response regulator [Clostridiales Family XIII bacterium]|jgi:signal transduction histidine kinase/DNA-binding response OmpR family regulator|nr:response regulator [Clostridiales Family XIII bacterium]